MLTVKVGSNDGSFFPHCHVHPSETESCLEWMELDLNENLQSIVRKGFFFPTWVIDNLTYAWMNQSQQEQ